jgi:hypothetical protein
MKRFRLQLLGWLITCLFTGGCTTLPPEAARNLKCAACLANLVDNQMTREEVLALMGPPQQTAANGAMSWSVRYNAMNRDSLRVSFTSSGQVDGITRTQFDFESGSEGSLPGPTIADLEQVHLGEPVRTVIRRLGPYTSYAEQGVLVWELPSTAQGERAVLKATFDDKARIAETEIKKITTVSSSKLTVFIRHDTHSREEVETVKTTASGTETIHSTNTSDESHWPF